MPLVLAQNSPELSLLKILPLTYHHSHFLATTLDFTSFFTLAFFGGGAFFFTAWLFWIRYHFFLYLYTPKLAYGRLWGFFNLSFFFFTTGRRKRFNQNHNQDLKQIFNTLIMFGDFISNIIQSTYIYYMPIISCRIT